MKIEARTTDELTRLAQLLEHMNVAMLTTLGDDGQLESRPMMPLELDAQGALWFFTDARSTKVDHLDRVNLSFSEPSRQTHVSLSGRGELVADRGHVERLWTPMARPWFPQGPDSPELSLLRIVPQRVDYWDAPDSKMVRLFAMAASVVGGRPVGMGHHETMTLR